VNSTARHTFEVTDEAGGTVTLTDDSTSAFALIKTGSGVSVQLDLDDVDRLRDALFDIESRLRARQPVQDSTP
jgi:uncharacterized protein RhaS with RHS repeats